MLTPIPAYAKGNVDSFLQTGTIPNLQDKKVELSADDVKRAIQDTTDSFTRWTSLEDSPQNELKGTKGEVKVEVPQWKGFQQASLSGDANNGTLVMLDHTPNEHYTAESVTATKTSPDSIDILTQTHSVSASWGLEPSITHIDLKNNTGWVMWGPDKAQ